MVKSERERKPYDEKNPGIELQNWIGPRMKEESAKDNTKVPSRGLNQMRCVAKENDYKYAGETLLRIYKAELGMQESPLSTMIYQADRSFELDR